MIKHPNPIQTMLVAARRTQILDAAITVFSEKGFHRATIKEIARVAGIADGTIYTYFASKDEVLLAVLDRLNETTERRQQFVLGDEQDLKAFFRAYLQQRMALLWPNAEVFRAVLAIRCSSMGKCAGSIMSRCSRQPLPLVSSFFRHRTNSSRSLSH